MTRTLYPVANSVGPQQVRETDETYIIEDVPIVRPMELAGGYVPEQSVRETAAAWTGVPTTLNHPRDDRGQPVAANRQPETHLGETDDTYYDGTHVRGNLQVEKDRLDAVGGEAEDIRRALETGEQIDVSSQYSAEPLPPGEYDGEDRSEVERITRPDSVAILPNKAGVCSIEDGCGINPQLAANAEVSVPMTVNTQHGDGMNAAAEAAFSAGDLVRWSTSASPGTGRVNTVVTEPGATVSAEGADATRKATEDEAVYKLDNWVGPKAGFEEGVVVKSASEMIDEWDDAPEEAMSANDGEMRNNGLAAAFDTLRQAVFGADDSITLEDPGATAANTAGGDGEADREMLIDDITTYSPLTRNALEARCDDGLQAIHEDVMAASGKSGTDSADDADTTNSEDSTMSNDDSGAGDGVGLDDLTDNAREALVDEAVEQIEANREDEQKEELVSEIIANSAEYDADDRETLLEAPLEVLRDLKPASTAASVPGAGATANAQPSVGSDEAEEYPDGTIGGDL